MSLISEAYQEGQKAGKEKFDSNPYWTPEVSLYFAWERGADAAKRRDSTKTSKGEK